MHPLLKALSTQRGVYSCCSANEFVLRASLRKAAQRDTCALIEATSNQVNQFGGYTGMTPAMFRDYVRALAAQEHMQMDRVILGGDHLGPLIWTEKSEDEAMMLAEELVRSYVSAGFSKIHIDTSMRVKGDSTDERLSDAVIADRGARLCAAAEETAAAWPNQTPKPVYIVGSEVPIPGGAQEIEESISVTDPQDFKRTLEAFREAFQAKGLQDAWERVLGIVVQPGVEFGDSEVFEYDHEAASQLTEALRNYPNLMFEGHSTDYQTPTALKKMATDGIRILKVGPELTFALREGLFALEGIERELIAQCERSRFCDRLIKAMNDSPKNWEKHYHCSGEALRLSQKYSMSDRARYYLPVPDVRAAIETLLSNLDKARIPLTVISQYMPMQYRHIREGLLPLTARDLLIDHVGDVIDCYLDATL